jgi:hypothetical protein
MFVIRESTQESLQSGFDNRILPAARHRTSYLHCTQLNHQCCFPNVPYCC